MQRIEIYPFRTPILVKDGMIKVIHYFLVRTHKRNYPTVRFFKGIKTQLLLTRSIAAV